MTGSTPQPQPHPQRRPLRQRLPHRLPRRLVQLFTGLVLYGVSMGLLLRAGLGLEPWNVFHQGIAEHTGLTIGIVTVLSSLAVLLLWLPLRVRPGFGTLANALLIGLVMDGTIALVPAPQALAVRIPLMVFAIVLNGAATGLYISACFGPGARDGLMTGLHLRTGRSIRTVRTGIEIVVTGTGVLLGGSIGPGTLLYALAIGPLAQLFLRLFAIKGVAPSRVVSEGAAPAEGEHPANSAYEERPAALPESGP